MALTPEKATAISARLIDGKFASWRGQLVFTINGGVWDPETETMTGSDTVYSYMAISKPPKQDQWDSVQIAVTDKEVAYTAIDDFKPSVTMNCTFDGVAYQVISAALPDKKVAYRLLLRAL